MHLHPLATGLTGHVNCQYQWQFAYEWQSNKRGQHRTLEKDTNTQELKVSEHPKKVKSKLKLIRMRRLKTLSIVMTLCIHESDIKYAIPYG